MWRRSDDECAVPVPVYRTVALSSAGVSRGLVNTAGLNTHHVNQKIFEARIDASEVGSASRN